jgi:hypothetical protein
VRAGWCKRCGDSIEYNFKTLCEFCEEMAIDEALEELKPKEQVSVELEIFKAEDFAYTEVTKDYGHSCGPQTAKAFADKANCIFREWLAAQPVVYGVVGEASNSWHSEKPGTYIQENYTHRAYLVDVRPIERDSAEKVLKDLVNIQLTWDPSNGKSIGSLIERARKLVGGK